MDVHVLTSWRSVVSALLVVMMGGCSGGEDDVELRDQSASATGYTTQGARVVRLEAESMSLRTYRVTTAGPQIASGGRYISLKGGQKLERGVATTSFGGPTGAYDVVVAYFDENDGTARLTLSIGGSQVASWLLSQQLGDNAASARNHVRRTVVRNKRIDRGTSIVLAGEETELEYARVDYIEFVPANTPTRIEAESMSLRTYRVTTAGPQIASGGRYISLKGGQKLERGVATTSFGGPTGAYDVVVAYFDENDGTARLTLSIGGSQVASWLLSQQLGDNAASARNHVRRTVARGRKVSHGSRIELVGDETELEYARVDYIEFVPVSASTSPAVPTTFDDVSPQMLERTDGCSSSAGQCQDNGARLRSTYLKDDPDAVAVASGSRSWRMPANKYFEERGFGWRLVNAMRMVGYEESGVPWGAEIRKPQLIRLDQQLAAAERVFEKQAAKFPFWAKVTTPAFRNNLPRSYSAYMYATVFDLLNAGRSYYAYTYPCLIGALVPAMCTPFQGSTDGTGLACRAQSPRTYPLVIDDAFIAGWTNNLSRPSGPEDYPPHGWVSQFQYIDALVHEMAHGLASYAVGSVSFKGMQLQVDYDEYNLSACNGLYMAWENDASPFNHFTVPKGQGKHPSFYVSGYADKGGFYEDHAESVAAYVLLPEYFRRRMKLSPELRRRYDYIRGAYFAGREFHNPNIILDTDARRVSDTKLYYQERPALARFVLHDISSFICGDGKVDPGETCDDRNTADGDGCDSSCQRDACSLHTKHPANGTAARFTCSRSAKVGSIYSATCPAGYWFHVEEGSAAFEKLGVCVDEQGHRVSPSKMQGSCC
jgi:cysteine-rich repeat protein